MTCILVVDDEADQRLRIKHVLVQQGYQVLQAGDGVEALAILKDRGRADRHHRLGNAQSRWPAVVPGHS